MNRRTSFRRGPVAISRMGKGFSLIEILVVLVILLIGILAILRLFPGGFLTIVRTGEMTAAQALVDQQTNNRRNQTFTVEASGAGLPNVNGGIVLIKGIRPDDLTDLSFADLTQIYNNQNPPLNPIPGYSPYYFSNINKLRYVIGETLRIPMVSPATPTFAAAGGTVYTLQYGPVFNMFSGDQQNPKDSIKVYGAGMTRVEQNSAAVTGTDLIGALPDGSLYAIDYANNKIAFYPRPTNNNGANISHGAAFRLFRLTAAIYEPDPNNNSSFITDHTDITINVDDQAPVAGQPLVPQWQDIKILDCNGADISAKAHLWPNTEQVSRKFRLITQSTGPNPSFSDDPYEYAWYSGQVPNTNNLANLGTLVFNPKGHVYNPAADSNPQPGVNDAGYLKHADNSADTASLSNTNNLIARIDYLTFDNHIIRDDRNVPGSFPYAVRLSVSYIATAGDIQADQSTYNGMFSEVGSNGTPDVIVYNMTTGTIISQISGGTSSGVVPASVDAKTGLLTLGDPTKNGTDVEAAGLQSAALRVFYRTQKEYGMQVQQASAQYLPMLDPDCLDHKSFYIGGSSSGGAANKLYFDVSQAGKTINIGEYYTGPTISPSDRHTNETFQITDNPADFETIPGKGTYAWVQLKGNLTSAATGRAVNNVQGASLKSRVIWIGSTQVNKDGNGNPVILKRWRKVDNDTVLQANN